MSLRCPLHYFFRYICGLKISPTGDLTLGRSAHKTLRDNYRQKIQSYQDLPLSQVADIFSDYWEKGVQETVFSEDEKPSEPKAQGAKLLTAYRSDISPRVQSVEVEREFLLDTGVTELPFKGYIDLIDKQRYIIDHKTSKRSFPRDAAKKTFSLLPTLWLTENFTGRTRRVSDWTPW